MLALASVSTLTSLGLSEHAEQAWVGSASWWQGWGNTVLFVQWMFTNVSVSPEFCCTN